MYAPKFALLLTFIIKGTICFLPDAVTTKQYAYIDELKAKLLQDERLQAFIRENLEKNQPNDVIVEASVTIERNHCQEHKTESTTSAQDTTVTKSAPAPRDSSTEESRGTTLTTLSDAHVSTVTTSQRHASQTPQRGTDSKAVTRESTVTPSNSNSFTASMPSTTSGSASVSKCSTDSIPANGKVTCYPDFGLSWYCYVFCDDGYDLRGSLKMNCVNHGSSWEWSSDIPQCVKCPQEPITSTDCGLQYRGSCFAVFTTEATRTDAKIACSNWNGNLTNVYGYEHLHLLERYVSQKMHLRSLHTSFHTGMSCSGDHALLRNLDPVVEFKLYCNKDSPAAAAISKSSCDSWLYPTVSNLLFPFICERPSDQADTEL